LEQTPEPEESASSNESQTDTEELTSEPKSGTPEVEESPVIQPVPVRPIQPEQPKGFFKRFQRSEADKVAPDSGLPPTLPEIVETPTPQSSEPKAAVPQPEPAIAPESAPATSSEPAPTPEATNDQAPTPSDSEAPKLDLKELFVSPPAPSPRIIQAPSDAASDIPSRYLKKSAPETPTDVPSSLAAPTADTEPPTDMPLEEEAIPEAS
jgi:hypothetical protein